MQQATIESILREDLDAYDAVVRQFQGMLLGYAANRLPDVDAAQPSNVSPSMVTMFMFLPMTTSTTTDGRKPGGIRR